MDQVSSSGSDLDHIDIDLESGGSTSDEDVRKLSHEDPKNLLSRINRMSNSDEIHYIKNKEMQLSKSIEEMENFKDKKKKLYKKLKSTRPPKPPRPPRGPSLGTTCDTNLLEEISELKRRRKMEKIEILRKTKKHKTSPLNSNPFACLVTAIFFILITFQVL